MANIGDSLSGRLDFRRYVRQFGESLGPTPAVVAHSMRDLHVRGIPKSETDCVVARCLQAIIGVEPSVTDIKVSHRSVMVKRTDRHFPVTIGLPKSVSKFISAFDRGCYPELVDHREGPTNEHIPRADAANDD